MSGGGNVRTLMFFVIDVDETDAADPVKRRGPYTFVELSDLYNAGKVDEDTYVWADGRTPDFVQVKTLPDLHDALTESSGGATSRIAPSSSTSGRGTPDVRTARWFYKDKSGVKLGPAVMDTLKIMWDYGEVKEDTPVMADTMTDYKPLREVPDLLKALTMGVASLGPNPEATKKREELAVSAEQERAATKIQSRFRGNKMRKHHRGKVLRGVQSSRPGAVSALRHEQERDARRREVQLAAREADVAARELEADRRIMEASTMSTRSPSRSTPGPGVYGGLGSAGSPLGPRDLSEEEDFDGAESDEIPVSRRVRTARGTGGPLSGTGNIGARRHPRATSAADSLLGPMPDISSMLGRAKLATPDAFRGPSKGSEGGDGNGSGGGTLASAIAMRTGGGPAGGPGGPFTMFHGEMAALESEYSRVRSKLEGEYGALHATLTSKLNDLSHQLRSNRERIEEAERGMELEAQEIEKERARLSKERSRLTEKRNREAAQAEAGQLQIDEAKKRIGKEVERREKKVSEAERSLREQRDVLQREQNTLDEEQRRATRERNDFLEDTARGRKELEDARRQLDDDVVDFGKYRDEVEKLLEAKRALLKEEQEDFIKTKAETLNALEARTREVTTEVAAAGELRGVAEAEYQAAEAEWTQRGAYLDLHQSKVEEDRKAFEDYRTRVETEISDERKKLADHLRAIDAREAMSEDLFMSGHKRLERDRLHLQEKMESERRALEEQRLRQARETVETAGLLGAKSALYAAHTTPMSATHGY